MAEVTLTGIRKSFTDPAGEVFEALKPLDLEIDSGECFSLLGPSGCGKTTLLRIIAGLESPDSGTITMGGVDVTSLPPEKRPTAMVFQNYALFPHLTVERNVGFGLKVRKKSEPEIRKKVEEVLELVHLSGLQGRKINELSGGQQQRVALARVLAVEPSVILMDEPLSNLDASLRRSTRSAIRRIQKDLGLTLIYVTHDQEEGLMISDRLALMKEGRILQAGSPRVLYERPASASVAMFLGQRNMIGAKVRRIVEERIDLVLSDDPATAILEVTAPKIGNGIGEGDDVWFALKPDEVVLKREAQSEGSGWPGEIALTSFAGSNIEVEVTLVENAQSIRAFRSARFDGDEAEEPLARGDEVRLHVRPDAGLIYPRAAGSGEAETLDFE